MSAQEEREPESSEEEDEMTKVCRHCSNEFYPEELSRDHVGIWGDKRVFVGPCPDCGNEVKLKNKFVMEAFDLSGGGVQDLKDELEEEKKEAEEEEESEAEDEEQTESEDTADEQDSGAGEITFSASRSDIEEQKPEEKEPGDYFEWVMSEEIGYELNNEEFFVNALNKLERIPSVKRFRFLLKETSTGISNDGEINMMADMYEQYLSDYLEEQIGRFNDEILHYDAMIDISGDGVMHQNDGRDDVWGGEVVSPGATMQRGHSTGNDPFGGQVVNAQGQERGGGRGGPQGRQPQQNRRQDIVTLPDGTEAVIRDGVVYPIDGQGAQQNGNGQDSEMKQLLSHMMEQQQAIVERLEQDNGDAISEMQKFVEMREMMEKLTDDGGSDEVKQHVQQLEQQIAQVAQAAQQNGGGGTSGENWEKEVAMRAIEQGDTEVLDYLDGGLPDDPERAKLQLEKEKVEKEHALERDKMQMDKEAEVQKAERWSETMEQAAGLLGDAFERTLLGEGVENGQTTLQQSANGAPDGTHEGGGGAGAAAQGGVGTVGGVPFTQKPTEEQKEQATKAIENQLPIEMPCPDCGETVTVTEDEYERDEVICGGCGNTHQVLEFE